MDGLPGSSQEEVMQLQLQSGNKGKDICVTHTLQHPWDNQAKDSKNRTGKAVRKGERSQERLQGCGHTPLCL